MLISTALRILLLLFLGLILYFIIFYMSERLVDARLRLRKKKVRHANHSTKIKIAVIYTIFLYLLILISYLIIKSMI